MKDKPSAGISKAAQEAQIDKDVFTAAI